MQLSNASRVWIESKFLGWSSISCLSYNQPFPNRTEDGKVQFEFIFEQISNIGGLTFLSSLHKLMSPMKKLGLEPGRKTTSRYHAGNWKWHLPSMGYSPGRICWNKACGWMNQRFVLSSTANSVSWKPTFYALLKLISVRPFISIRKTICGREISIGLR